MHEFLTRLARDGGLALANLLTDHPTPDGWDSEAFVTIMYEASRGLGLPGSSSPTNRKVLDIIEDFRGGRIKKSLQSKIYKAIQSDMPSDWLDLLNRRFEKLCPDMGTLTACEFDIIRGNFCKYAKKYGSHSAMYSIKSCTNGWLTSYRMNETPKLPCIFGCEDCQDKLEHYINCPTLWSIIQGATQWPFGLIDLSTPTRLCLANPSFDHLNALGYACWLYHGLKIGQRVRIDELLNLGSFAEVRTLAEELVNECPLKTS